MICIWGQKVKRQGRHEFAVMQVESSRCYVSWLCVSGCPEKYLSLTHEDRIFGPLISEIICRLFVCCSVLRSSCRSAAVTASMQTSTRSWWSWIRRRSLWWRYLHYSQCSHWSSGSPILPSTWSHCYRQRCMAAACMPAPPYCVIPASWRLSANCWSWQESGAWSVMIVFLRLCQLLAGMMFCLSCSDWSLASGLCPASLPLMTLKSQLSMSATPCRHRSASIYHYQLHLWYKCGWLCNADVCVLLSVCVCHHFLWTKYLRRLWTDFDEISSSGEAWPWDQLIRFWWRSENPLIIIIIIIIIVGLCSAVKS